MQTPRGADAPRLTSEREVALHPVEGRLHAIAAFVDEHCGLLSAWEQRVLADAHQALDRELPAGLEAPLVRGHCRGRGARAAQAMGARSAYLLDCGLKLKGCRPEAGTFPSWTLDEQRRVRVTEVPFGVLCADHVVREALAYCFQLTIGVAPTSVPVAVIEYSAIDGPGRFCLVSRGACSERLEARIDCGGMTLHRLLRLHASRARGRFLGREVGLAGMDAAQYARDKAAALSRMHFAGGFRGILNSNIGNDVVDGARLIGLCDFDTFTVTPLPSAESAEAVSAFVFKAFIETIKSSLPFIDYLPGAARAALAPYYRRRSTIYRAYLARFLEEAAARRWDLAQLARDLDEVFASEVAVMLIEELVPNAVTIREFTCDSWYVPHA